jgi:hypothetical protein
MTPADDCALPERLWGRALQRELGAVILVYAAVLVPSLLLVDHTSGTLRYAVSVLPIVPFAATGWIMARSIRRVDERERLLTYQAISVAFFGTAVVTFGYGFLENAGAPRLSMFAVWPVMASMWVVGRTLASRMP